MCLKGLGKAISKVSGCEAGDVMLDVNCGQSNSSAIDDGESTTSETTNTALSIANVTLEAYSMEICLLVNAGDVLLENCLVSFFTVHKLFWSNSTSAPKNQRSR
jgi:hypothetical protein